MPQAQVSTSSTITGNKHSVINGTTIIQQANATDKCDATNVQDTLITVLEGLNGGSDWTQIQAKLLGAFVGFGILSLLLIYFFVPETKMAAKGKKSTRTIYYISLEELNHIFKVYTRDFIRWQLTKVLPYEVEIIKYIIGVRKEKPKLEPLYRWSKNYREGEGDPNAANGGDRGSRAGTQSRNEVSEVLQVSNPGPNDSGREHERRQGSRHNEGRSNGSRQVSASDDRRTTQLSPPNPSYHEAERAGSIDRDPNLHLSPDTVPPGPRSQAERGEGANGGTVSPPWSRGARGTTEEHHDRAADPPSPETEVRPSDARMEEFPTRRSQPSVDAGASQRNTAPSPQIRRKPLPPSSRTRDGPRGDNAETPDR